VTDQAGALSWLVYACRSEYTVDVVEVIRRTGGTVAALVDNLEGAASDPQGDPPVLRPTDLSPALRSLPAVIPLITPGHRHTVVAQARQGGIVHFPSLIDPTAVVAASATFGEGTVINAGAIVAGEAAVHRFVHVNRGASVGHHSVLMDFSTLGPGCILAGRVRVEPGAFLGAGAVCAPKVTIGRNAIVGAGAVVIADVPPGAVVVGNPAGVVRHSEVGYGGVAVPP